MDCLVSVSFGKGSLSAKVQKGCSCYPHRHHVIGAYVTLTGISFIDVFRYRPFSKKARDSLHCLPN